MVDFMVFKVVSNITSVISHRPENRSTLFLSFFNQCSTVFLSHWPIMSIVAIMVSGETGFNPLSMTIINLQKEIGSKQASNQRPPVLKSCTLPTELLALGIHTVEFYVSICQKVEFDELAGNEVIYFEPKIIICIVQKTTLKNIVARGEMRFTINFSC